MKARWDLLLGSKDLVSDLGCVGLLSWTEPIPHVKHANKNGYCEEQAKTPDMVSGTQLESSGFLLAVCLFCDLFVLLTPCLEFV